MTIHSCRNLSTWAVLGFLMGQLRIVLDAESEDAIVDVFVDAITRPTEAGETVKKLVSICLKVEKKLSCPPLPSIEGD